MAGTDNEGENESEKISERKGGFAQVVHEISEFLSKPPCKLTARENQIIWFFVRELIGYGAQYKPITVEAIVKGTGLPKQRLHPDIASLVQKKILVKVRLKGLRCSVFGFNKITFGRILAGEVIMDTFSMHGKVIDLRTFKVTKARTLKVTEPDTFNYQKPATGAGLRKPKEISNKVLNKSLRDFLINLPRQSKSRWERVVDKVLTQYPEDESLLWFAIDITLKTGKDFYEMPIKRSVIGLFESADWTIIKAAVTAMLDRVRANEEKERKRQENERLIEATRRQLGIPEDEKTQDKAPTEIGKILKMINSR